MLSNFWITGTRFRTLRCNGKQCQFFSPVDKKLKCSVTISRYCNSRAFYLIKKQIKHESLYRYRYPHIIIIINSILSVFLFDKEPTDNFGNQYHLQIIWLISATDNWLICRLKAQCMHDSDNFNNFLKLTLPFALLVPCSFLSWSS